MGLGGQPGPELGPLGPERLDALVGAVQLEQPATGLGGPGQHLVDGPAVLAGERGEGGATLRHRREPGRVGLEPGGVRRDVRGGVGEQVGHLGEPVGELPGLRIVVPDALEQRPGGGRGAQRVGTPLLAGQGLAGLLGRGAQGVGVAEPGLLRRELDVLPGLRGGGLDLADAEPEQVGLPGTLARMRHHVGQLALDGDQPFVPVAVRLRAPPGPPSPRSGPAPRAGSAGAAVGAGRTGRARRRAAR